MAPNSSSEHDPLSSSDFSTMMISMQTEQDRYLRMSKIILFVHDLYISYVLILSISKKN